MSLSLKRPLFLEGGSTSVGKMLAKVLSDKLGRGKLPVLKVVRRGLILQVLFKEWNYSTDDRNYIDTEGVKTTTDKR